ncbi:MAG: YfhO family protein [Chitinophagaceae bacterium]|nr:YfhO family protein [Chitinophagaceae bacterium]
MLTILVVAWWPVSFHVYSLKNDALNYFLPVRRLVSESFYHHILPLWTPYLNMGYPLHGDMQSGVWNPFVQILSLFGPYTLYTLQIETLLYVYLSGCGMFFLLKYFRVHPHANLLASVAYMLSGFNTDSGQFLNWIAGASFLPFLFLFYHRCLKEGSANAAVYAGVFLFLLLTCAYPADFIIAAYLLLAMTICHLAVTYRHTKRFTISKKFLAVHMVMGGVFLVLSAPAILSYSKSLPLMERGAGATYADVMSNPLHPLLAASYTTPLAVWKMPRVSITDALERNSFMGIAGFILLLCSFLVSSTSGMVRFSKYAAIAFLLFSLGEPGILRMICYYILPLMNSFRHPANAKMFTIFFSCMLAAFAFDAHIQNKLSRPALKSAISAAIILAAGVLIWSLASTPLFEHAGAIQDGNVSFGQCLKNRILKMNFSQIALLTTLMQIPFFVLLWRWLVNANKPVRVMQLAIVNSVIFCILAQPFTVVKNEKASTIQSLVDKMAINGYPVPGTRTSLRENSVDGMKYFKEIGVLNLYNKKPGRVDYRITPSNLLSQNEFWSDTSFRETVLDYPLIYQSDSVSMNNRKLLKPVASDAVIHVTKLLPNCFQFKIKNVLPGYYVLLQNYSPCWSIFENGRMVNPEKVNVSFMGFNLPEGDHVVEFRYIVPGLRILFWISSIMLALITLYSLLSNSNLSGRSRRPESPDR